MTAKKVTKKAPAKSAAKKTTSGFDKWWKEIGNGLMVQGHGVPVIVREAVNASKSKTTYQEYVSSNPEALRGSVMEDIARKAYEA